jgi:predicted GH43/DUF377 family glycosyl hydrolase
MKKPEPLEFKVIAGPEDFEPSSPDMKVVGAFNPGVTTIEEDGIEKTLLMVRVCEMPAEEPPGIVLLPHFTVTNSYCSPFKIEFDKETIKDLKGMGKKEVTLNNGLSRLRHISYPVKVVSTDGINIDWEKGREKNFYPCYEHERFGMEDLRIVRMVHPYDGHVYVITYVSPHRRHGVSTSIAITRDFKTFERLPYGAEKPYPVFRNMKDVVPFPEMVPSPEKKDNLGNRKMEYGKLTRSNAFSDISSPTISVVYSEHIEDLGPEMPLEVSADNEISGTGAAVVGLEDIWLGVYHIIKTEAKEGREIKKYYGALFGLKKDEPHKLLFRSGILMQPDEHDRGHGFVPKVVYPQGLIIQNNYAYIYSGEDDTWVSVRKYNLEDLIMFLKDSNSYH